MTEYEIIADPRDYGIENLVEGLNGSPMLFPTDERKKWAVEIASFSERLTALSDKARKLQSWLDGDMPIKATPASLKTLKIQFFKINDAMETAWELSRRIECDIIECKPE
jgi:hypothetical protein